VNAQTGIGTSTPDASAKLEVSSSNKGFLPPRVSLTSITDITTILSPATGLLVYCKGDAGLSPGYYFWNGSAWDIIATSDGNTVYSDGPGLTLNNGVFSIDNSVVTNNYDGIIRSNVSTGTAPLIISSTTKISNLNVDLLDGLDSSELEILSNKSNDIITDGTSETKYPSVKSVKTYVDSQITSGTATNVSGVVAVANGGTGVTTATGNGNTVLSNGPTIEMPVISSGSTRFPTSINVLPSTFATSKRAALWLGDWGLLQDFDGDGTKNFSITQNFSGTYPTRFFISTNGNVGIGNSAPTETLEVTGNVKATNFIGTASSALSAPTNINYYSTTIATVLNIENGNYIDLINFTLPSAGTYKITYIIRNYVSLSNTTGLVFLRESSNAQVPDSVLMPQYGKSDNQAVGTQIVFLTIDASKTYKLTAWTQPGTGAQHILNDGNGYSKLIWEKIQ